VGASLSDVAMRSIFARQLDADRYGVFETQMDHRSIIENFT